MKKQIILSLAIIVLFTAPTLGFAQPFLPATEHQATIPSDSLTAEQYARAGELAGMLMAPCCYSKTAAEDQSGAAYGVKMEVRRGILAGYSNDDILQGFARVYGERILAQPTAVGFNKMAWIMPIVALLIGVFIYVGFIRKTSKKPTPAKQENVKKKQADGTGDDPYLKRLERELDEFES
jgi:cytochrome c-type biogenesis protein CcmH